MKSRRLDTSLKDRKVELWTPWGVLRLSGPAAAERERREREKRERFPDSRIQPPVSSVHDWDGEPLN